MIQSSTENFQDSKHFLSGPPRPNPQFYFGLCTRLFDKCHTFRTLSVKITWSFWLIRPNFYRQTYTAKFYPDRGQCIMMQSRSSPLFINVWRTESNVHHLLDLLLFLCQQHSLDSYNARQNRCRGVWSWRPSARRDWVLTSYTNSVTTLIDAVKILQTTHIWGAAYLYRICLGRVRMLISTGSHIQRMQASEFRYWRCKAGCRFCSCASLRRFDQCGPISSNQTDKCISFVVPNQCGISWRNSNRCWTSCDCHSARVSVAQWPMFSPASYTQVTEGSNKRSSSHDRWERRIQEET